MDWWMVLRIFCILGCCVSGVLLSTARYRQWDTWTNKTKDHWWALGSWVFLGAYGTIENILQGNPGGSRLIVLTLVVALTLRAITLPGEVNAQASLTRKEDLA